jgi:DNA-directed RNA polymerase delta subunit
MQVDSSFEAKLKDLQKAIRMKRGEEMSLREITARVVKDPNFERIEQRLIGNDLSKIKLNIKLDGRFLE